MGSYLSRVTTSELFNVPLSWWCHSRCRGYGLVVGSLGRWGNRGGRAHSRGTHDEQPRTRKNKQNQEHKSTPRCTLLRGPSCEGNTPTAALAYSLYISMVASTGCSLSCINGESSRKKMEQGENELSVSCVLRSSSVEMVVLHI